MTSDKKNILLILTVGLLAWFPTLNFWFFKAYEATWLTGFQPYTLINLIKGHAILYFLDQKLFGWNPAGWYATSLFFHSTASILLFWLVFLISKNRTLSLVASLFFVASTSYNDVLTWGSFNSYYPLLLIFFLSALVTFIKFKETQKTFFLFLSIAFVFIGFFVRETGVVIIPLITLFDIVFSKNLTKRKTIIFILKRQVPFYVTMVLFFIIRSSYGGTPGDSADSNVKLQMRFVADGLYLEYAKATILTIGKLIPPQIVPYALLNSFRELLSRFIPLGIINTYFFSFLGFGILTGIALIWQRLKKSKDISRIFLFFIIWLGAFSLFVSLAVPNTPEVLAREYEYNTMRYRYFAFVGTSVLMACVISYFLRNKKRALFLIIASIVLANILLLWRIEGQIYATSYKPAKEFYKNFRSYFPTLPRKSVFYLYPHAPALSDYFLEWNLTKEESYPNLVGEPFRVESQMIAVLNKIKKGEMKVSETFFLDHERTVGLINVTDRARNLILNQREYKVEVNKITDNFFQSKKFDGHVVEIPYNVEVKINLMPRGQVVGEKADSDRFRALVDYSVERQEYLTKAKVNTAYTMSQRAGEPFFHVLPSNLIDGNIGSRSIWIADDWAPWVQVDMGKEMDVLAISWGSMSGGTRIPATYKILSSRDGKRWESVWEVKNNSNASAIDTFEKPIKARFIRMEIKTTSGGDFVLLDEFEVFSLGGQKALSYYKDRDKLLKDFENMFDFVQSPQDLEYMRMSGLNTHLAIFVWETNFTTSSQNSQILLFPYRIDVASQSISFELPEMEIYSGTGQFLKKRINSLSIDFGSIPYDVSIDSLEFLPRIRL